MPWTTWSVSGTRRLRRSTTNRITGRMTCGCASPGGGSCFVCCHRVQRRSSTLGCGTGSLTTLLAECGYDTTGIDVSRAMANAANCAAELVVMQREGFTPEVFAYWESDASAGPWIARRRRSRRAPTRRVGGRVSAGQAAIAELGLDEVELVDRDDDVGGAAVDVADEAGEQ